MDIPRIKIVPDNAQVWLVYAGVRRRHLELFRRSNSIFLELPGFNANQETFENDTEIGQRLAMSRAVRRWLVQKNGARPTSRIGAYAPESYASGTPEARGLTAELGNIQRMFRDAKAGDLVISPPIGHYNPLLIGEIRGTWSDDQRLEVPYFDGEQVPVRKVRWLETRITRREFSPDLARNLQNQHAISQVDPYFMPEILRRAYTNFAWQNTSKLDIFGTNYTGEDPTQLNSTAALLKYCTAAVIAFERGEVDAFLQLDAQNAGCIPLA